VEARWAHGAHLHALDDLIGGAAEISFVAVECARVREELDRQRVELPELEELGACAGEERGVSARPPRGA
jgi:hypothetical protein